IRRRAAHACATRAGIIRGAGVAVAAWGHIVHVHAAAGWIARIIRAHVVVVAIQRRTADARSKCTCIVCGTGVAVVAPAGVVVVIAARYRVAAVIRAYVSVVAVRRWASHAGSTRTSVVRRAGVAVVTRIGVVGVIAAGGRIAGIIRTDVAVVAVGR